MCCSPLVQRRLQSSGASDPYQVLGVSRSASDAEIKSAYKKRAMEYHPDRNKAKGAEEKFKDISEAYQRISDAGKRKSFDMGQPGGGFQGAGSNTQGAGGSAHGSAAGGFPSGQNPFGAGFGGGGAGSPHQRFVRRQMSQKEAEALFSQLFGGMSMNPMGSGMGGGMGPGMTRQRVVHRGDGSFTREEVVRDSRGNTYVRHTSTGGPGSGSSFQQQFYQNTASSGHGGAGYGASSQQHSTGWGSGSADGMGGGAQGGAEGRGGGSSWVQNNKSAWSHFQEQFRQATQSGSGSGTGGAFQGGNANGGGFGQQSSFFGPGWLGGAAPNSSFLQPAWFFGWRALVLIVLLSLGMSVVMSFMFHHPAITGIVLAFLWFRFLRRPY